MNQNKAIIILSALLLISLMGNYYFYSSSQVDINEELIRSQEREEQYRNELSTLQSENDSLQAKFEAINSELSEIETTKTKIIKIYETKKADIVTLSADSGYKFFTNRLSKADSIRR